MLRYVTSLFPLHWTSSNSRREIRHKIVLFTQRSRTWAFSRYQNRWPWVTLNSQVAIIRIISHKNSIFLSHLRQITEARRILSSPERQKGSRRSSFWQYTVDADDAHSLSCALTDGWASCWVSVVTLCSRAWRPRHQTEIVNGARIAYTRAMSEHQCFSKKRLSTHTMHFKWHHRNLSKNDHESLERKRIMNNHKLLY